MKVYELLNESNIKHVTVKNMPDIKERNPKIGSGFEAEVYAAKDGATIIKELWIKESIETNASYQYINMVMSHQDNPYFPRIYNAKLYTSKREDDTHSKLIIQMEKLVEFDTSKTEHLLPQLIAQLGIAPDDVDGADTARRMKRMEDGSQWLEKIVDREFLLSIGADPDRKHPQQSEKLNRTELLRDIGGTLFSMFRTANGRNKLMQHSTNPELKEAIKLTGDIILKGERDNAAGSGRITRGDLHASNIMVRLTGHGPQLVITDPVISRGV